MVPRTISCISVGTLSHPSRRMPYNTPLPLPPTPPPPLKKKTQKQKQQSNFFYDLLVHLCTRKGEISKKKTSPTLYCRRFAGVRMFLSMTMFLFYCSSTAV